MKKNIYIIPMLYSLMFSVFFVLNNVKAYSESFGVGLSVLIQKEMVSITGYFVLVFLSFYIPRRFKKYGIYVVLLSLFAAYLLVRAEGIAYLKYLGYQDITAYKTSSMCSITYDPGIDFSAIDPYSGDKVNGFVCWEDFEIWRSSYYSH